MSGEAMTIQQAVARLENWRTDLRGRADSRAVPWVKEQARLAVEALDLLLADHAAKTEALRRIAHGGAFDVPRVLDPARDAELLARMKFAAEALRSQQGKGGEP